MLLQFEQLMNISWCGRVRGTSPTVIWAAASIDAMCFEKVTTNVNITKLCYHKVRIPVSLSSFYGLACVQAMENFAWNIRVLRGQADLLSQAKKDCNEYIRQVSNEYIIETQEWVCYREDSSEHIRSAASVLD